MKFLKIFLATFFIILCIFLLFFSILFFLLGVEQTFIEFLLIKKSWLVFLFPCLFISFVFSLNYYLGTKDKGVDKRQDEF